VVSSTTRQYFTLGKDPVPIVQEAGWAPGHMGLLSIFAKLKNKAGSITLKHMIKHICNWKRGFVIFFKKIQF